MVMVPTLFLFCVVALIVMLGAALCAYGMAADREAGRILLVGALITAINVLLTGLLLF